MHHTSCRMALKHKKGGDMRKKNAAKVFEVYYFEGKNRFVATLTIEDPDKLVNGKTALLTVKEPINIHGYVTLVYDTPTLTRNWEVVVPNHREGLKHEVIVITCSRIFKKQQDIKK